MYWVANRITEFSENRAQLKEGNSTGSWAESVDQSKTCHRNEARGPYYGHVKNGCSAVLHHWRLDPTAGTMATVIRENWATATLMPPVSRMVSPLPWALVLYWLPLESRCVWMLESESPINILAAKEGWEWVIFSDFLMGSVQKSLINIRKW